MIAIQTAVGDVGSKAVTELSYAFNALINTGSFQYGCNDDGIFLLNSGEQDNDGDYVRSFTLSSSDYGLANLKRIRFLYLGIDTDNSFTVSVMGDNKVWRDYTVPLNKLGLQEIRKSIGRDGFGRYWKIKISSTNRFRISMIGAVLVIRPLGLRG